jgi:hypothetical protein
MLGFSAISAAPIASLGGPGITYVDITGQQINISLGTIDVVSSFLLTGQQVNTSVNSVVPINSEQFINIPGQQAKYFYWNLHNISRRKL